MKREAPGSRLDVYSENLLFAALREVLGTGAGIKLTDILPHGANDFRGILAHSGKEYIDSMVARGFQLMGATDAETDLEKRTKRAVRRALILEHDRALIRDAFSAQGIEMLFFKGALCDPLWWGAQGMRGSTDIDVLIPRSAENAAASILINMGYERRRTPTHPATEDAAKERLFHHSDSQTRFPVDLHLGLLNDPPYLDPAEQVFRRAVVYETAVGTIRGPSREDMLLLAAGNLGQSCFAERYKLALDAACLLLRESIDFKAVVSRAAQWRVTTPLWALLRLIEERLRIPIPDWVRDKVSPPFPLKAIVERVAGVRTAPWHPESGRGLILAGWPLSGRVFWPLIAAWRWARLRIADRRSSRSALT
ncbi:MAG: nucleotidyltransferase family protein [Acidobacteria bacterium]|nr:nucleotidyltransferase family protein [Acidobacteriota bacterium]